MKKPMPTSIESYTEIKDFDYYLVDKTKIIEIFDNIKSVFFIRPRRFGKSLTLSMLGTFYDINYAKKFDKYFKGTYIYDKINLLKYKPNKVEVIRLSFKNIQGFDSLEGYRADIEEEILQDLLDRGIINTTLLEKYNNGLLKLGKLLKHLIDTKKQYIFLIDEYDTPVNHAIGIGNYNLAEKILEDLKSFYLILKGHDNVAKTVVTGINKLAKSGLFSGANQFVDITFKQNFSHQLGFLEEELKSLLDYTGIKNVSLEKLRSFYNGYFFCKKSGCKSVYNPYSMLNFIDNGGEFDMYWAGSGDYKYLSDLIKKLRINNKTDYEELIDNFENLFKGEEITIKLSLLGLNFNIKNIKKVDVLKLMLYTGFLTICESGLVIANKETFHEILGLYSSILQEEKLVNIDLLDTLGEFVITLKYEKINQLENYINKLIQAILKFRFTYYLKEQAYTLILASVFGFQTDYDVVGEQETGDGYADLVLTPMENDPGYIFEFKRLTDKQMKQPGLEGGLKGLEAGFNGAQEGDMSSTGNLKLAKKCIEQIKEKEYVNEMRKKNKKVKIYGVGVVMKGKKVVEMKVEEL